MRILVVDDEKLLVKGIKFNLENEGYQVDVGYDGIEAVEKARVGNYDLIILDLMMPRLDGLNACMQIRAFSTVPIVMLTAKSEDTDKLLGFEYGADDYITKPFNVLELKARIRALLRRSNLQSNAGPAEDNSAAIAIGHIVIDSLRRHAEQSGVAVELTAKEFDLIELLMKNPGRVYSRENLLDIVWGYDYHGDIRTVDVHIRRLREKLEPDPANPARIMTKWGVGYYLKAET
ncbi:MAG: response regulator transcription factor [Oscillospiraceae bacterium]|nr:response regulator transcription factor [Oscillospiraceae bacterium]